MFKFLKKENKDTFKKSKNISFEPQNACEKAILDFFKADITEQEFYTKLLNSNVRILSEVPDAKQKKFYTAYPDGETPYLAIFTDNDRTSRAKERKQGFDYLFVMPLADLLSSTMGTFGLLINPYWDFELKLDPEQVVKICTNLKSKALQVNNDKIEMTFNPRNEIENKIVAYRTRSIQFEEFINALVNSTVYVMSPTKNVDENRYFALYPKGNIPYIVIFTHEDKTAIVREKGQACEYLYSLHLGDMLNNIKNEFGLIINPYNVNEIMLPPEIINEIRSSTTILLDFHAIVEKYFSGKTDMVPMHIMQALTKSAIGVIVDEITGAFIIQNKENEKCYCIVSNPEQKQFIKMNNIRVVGESGANIIEYAIKNNMGIIINEGSKLEIVFTKGMLGILRAFNFK